jgi:hypothetical protein
VLVIDCTLIGALPPMGTSPTIIVFVRLRFFIKKNLPDNAALVTKAACFTQSKNNI